MVCVCYVCNSACDHCSLHVSQAATESDAYAPLPPNPYLLLLMLAHPFTLSPFHHFTLPPNIHPTSSHTHQPISPSAHHPIRPSSTGHQHPIIYGWSSVWPSTAVDIPYQTSIPPPPTSPSAHQSIIPSAHHHPPAFNTRSSTDGRRCGPPPPSISLTKHPSLLLPYPPAHQLISPSTSLLPSTHHPINSLCRRLIGKGPNVINLAPPSNKKMKHQYDFYRAHRAGGAFPLAGICPCP